MEKPSLALKNPSKKTSLTATDIMILRKLEDVMSRKMYLEPTISLIGLAAKLGTNRTYLSDIVHYHYGLSFADYINKLRIDEACRLMEEKSGDVVIKDLYKELGYNSATSFFRNFKRQTGMSTGEWIREMLMRQLKGVQ